MLREFNCEYPGCITSMTTNNKCCGVADFMVCDVCKLLVCKIHQEHHWGSGDRPEFTTCKNPECIEKIKERMKL